MRTPKRWRKWLKRSARSSKTGCFPPGSLNKSRVSEVTKAGTTVFAFFSWPGSCPMQTNIVQANRRAMNSVENWIRPEDYAASRDHYGCPPELVKLLDEPINQEPICTDLLV